MWTEMRGCHHFEEMGTDSIKEAGEVRATLDGGGDGGELLLSLLVLLITML